MGTILKYVFYVALILVVYLVAKGIYTGDINETTTVGQVVSDVGSGTKQIVNESIDAAQEAVEDYKDKPNTTVETAE